MLFINGRFLVQNLTGVQRTGIEITKALDKIVAPDTVKVLVPRGERVELGLNNIEIIEIGEKRNNLWTQIVFATYVIKNLGKTITFSGIPPIIKPDYFFVHDVTFWRWKRSFNCTFRLAYYMLLKLCIRHSKKILTVSEFSKSEICSVFRIDSRNVEVVYNASNHVRPLLSEAMSPKSLLQSCENFYLCVGSKNLHKNQAFIYKLAVRFPKKHFVIVGAENNNIFACAKIANEYVPNNITLLGRVSDNELCCLYQKCEGFIFPSYYEGFGIPPLEAITMGVKHIAVSDIPAHKEIYSKGLYFFDPYDADAFDFAQFLGITISENDRQYYTNKYSWQNSARIVKNICIEEENFQNHE